MTIRQTSLHPATVKAIADYLEDDAQQLIDSFSNTEGRIEQASIAAEVRKVRVWVAKLRAALQHTAEQS